MFEYVQEREVGKRLDPRTMVYIITTGEPKGFNFDELSERGENQLFELARSRVATGVRLIYSAAERTSTKSADLLAMEFGSKVTKTNCLNSVKFGKGTEALDELKDRLSTMWQDEEFVPEKGESLAEARERLGSCMGGIVAKHQDDVVAVIVSPIMAVLFHSHVAAVPLDITDWQTMGHASCASYEYSRGWSVIMPPDNSFLSDPTTVADTFPEGLL